MSSGSFLCGYLMKEYGGRIAFRIFGVTAICLSFIHYFVQRFLDTFAARRHGKTITNIHDKDNSHKNGALGITLGVDDKNPNNVEETTGTAQ